MMKRGKYYVAPPKDGRDFKQLFKYLVSEGAGLPADGHRLPIGVWTPTLLAETISQIDPNGSPVNLRTVQHWFYDNDLGISIENIQLLARVFGCNDPHATLECRLELSAANKRLAIQRKGKRNGSEKKGQVMSSIYALGHVAEMLGEEVSLLAAIVENDDNLTYGNVVNVQITKAQFVTALTDAGVDEIKEMLASARRTEREWQDFLSDFVSKPDARG